MTKQSLHIAMVVRALPQHRLGGLEFHTLDLCIALVEMGHRVSIITTEFSETNHFPQLDETCMPDSFSVYCIPGTKPGDYSIAFWSKLPQFVASLHQHDPFDIIHCQDFAGLFLPKEFPIPQIATVHGTMFSEVPLDHRYFKHMTFPEKLKAVWKYKSRLLLNTFFKKMLSNVPLILADSQFTRAELERLNSDLGSKIRVVPLGIDFRRYPSPSELHLPLHPSSDKPLKIVLIGRVQKIKGIFIALESANILAKKHIRFEMHIGGTGPQLNEAEEFITKNKLQDYVKLHGRIPPEDFAKFIESGDVFLFPDLTQPAFGLVALEAMHYGRPVIAANSGAIPEVIQNSGWIYNPWNPQELAGLIQSIIAKPTERFEKSFLAKDRADTFTVKAMAEQTLKAYWQILS